MIKYPNGHPHNHHGGNSSKKQANEKQNKKPINFGNRGMNFEEEINQSNRYYLNHDVAVIHKKPTPIQIVKVDYPRRSAAVITEAYFRHASTTDYNGVYQGYYLDFESKETKNKTSFPLNNFHEHQIIHMEQCQKHGGIVFVLLWFSSLQRCFFLPFEKLLTIWQNQKTTGVKSIALKEIEKNADEIILGIAPRVPYLDKVDKIIEQRRNIHD